MENVASVSFGKDSLAMLLMLIETGQPLDEVIFYDTGMEFQAIYDIRDRVKPILYAHGIKYKEIRPKNPFLYDMLERPVESEKKGKHNGYGWCGGVCRWGTKQKQIEIERYLRGRQVQRHYIGIAADEPKRFDTLQPPKFSPLIEAGMTEDDCLRYCAERGFTWDENGVDLYKILDRVSCWCCANKNRKELKNMYLHLPGYWERLKDLQRQIDRPMKKFKNQRYGEYGNVFDMEKVFEEELRCSETTR